MPLPRLAPFVRGVEDAPGVDIGDDEMLAV